MAERKKKTILRRMEEEFIRQNLPNAGQVAEIDGRKMAVMRVGPKLFAEYAKYFGRDKEKLWYRGVLVESTKTTKKKDGKS